MTKRSPVSAEQNIYFDSEQLDETDLTTEQNYNNNFGASLISNQIGDGVLPEVLVPNILFDSSRISGLLDGTAINTQNQPSDNNFGNQLAVSLTGSLVAGKKTIKIAIIGLDFLGNLQVDTLTFKLNETQVTSKHYVSILTILFNDFIGPAGISFNLGGRVVISEVSPLTLSRDPIMVSQDMEPNLFWRDFFVVGAPTLQALLVGALPLYNIDNLNIKISFLQWTSIRSGDVTSQVGEKFLATTNNIQKITLLLGVQNTVVGQATNLAWLGDLIVSIYPLQSAVDCPTDIVPNLPIDYSPSNIPLAQVSFNYSTLQATGVTLDGNAQPVDFVFSNTPVANGDAIIPGQYYVVTVKRSGSASQCDILLATGGSYSNTSWVTNFNGSLWVDQPDQELWFRVYSDSTKISDGQAYETGHGVMIPKTKLNPTTNAQADFSQNDIQFTGNEVFTAVVEATLQQSGTVQDQRTGNDVQSRQQFVPTIKLLDPISLANLEIASEPFIIGVATDQNQKSYNASNSTIVAALHNWNFINNQFVIKIIDDITDGYRYDPNVNSLVSNLINGDFTNAKIIPDLTNSNLYYRISKAELVSMIYGDVNGDGLVDDKDLSILNSLIGANLNVSPPADTQITTNGSTTTVVNGYPVYDKPFSNDTMMTWQVVNPITNSVLASGVDGILLANPNILNLATFESGSFNFTSMPLIGNMKLVITASTNTANIGSFPISGIDTTSAHILDISKLYLTSDIMMQILRADIDGDMMITTNDGYFLEQYIQKSPPFPTSLLPESKIGTQFNVIRLTVDPFIFKDEADTIPDRTDDFPFNASNRATTLHTTPDIFLYDGYFANHDFTHNPVTFNIVKQFSWEPSLIAVNSHVRFVPIIFSSPTGFQQNMGVIDGITYEVFPTSPNYDPGYINAFTPNDLIIGSGELKRTTGVYYKVDFEMGTIVLEIPDGLFGVEKTIDVFGDFVYDNTGHGVTRLGFPAMRFADGSFVQPNALGNGQVQFTAAVQSFSPNTNGLSPEGYTGAIVDGKMGVSMDYATGLLTLNFTNLYQDTVLQTLNTKVQVNVFLKKGGFNNLPIFVDSYKVQNLLSLVSTFSGAGTSGGPIEAVVYVPATPSDWVNPPTTVQGALDRIAALLNSKYGPIP